MRFFAAVSRFCVRNAWVVVVFVVLVTIASAVGHFTTPHRGRVGDTDIVKDDDLDLREWRITRDQFRLTRTDALLVIESDDVLSRSSVRAIRAAQRAIDAMPQVRTIRWLDDLPTLNIFGLPEPVLPNDDASEESFLQSRPVVLSNPLAVGQLVSPDGTTAVLPIEYHWLKMDADPTTVGHNAADESQIVAAAESAVAETQKRGETGASKSDGLRIRLTGNVPLFTATEEAFNANQVKFQVICYVLVISLAVFLFRGISAVFIVAAAPALGVLWSKGLLDLIGFEQYGLTSVVMPVLIIMVGLTDGIHLLVHIRRERLNGATPGEANCLAVTAVGPACFMTSLTTAIGFGSLILAESDLLRNFGKGCGFGVIVSFFAILTLIPLYCASPFGRKIHHGQERDIVGSNLAKLTWFVEWILQHARGVSYFGIGSLLVLSLSVMKLEPDYLIKHDLPHNVEAAQALMHCDDVLGGIDFVRLVVEWPETLDYDAPEILTVVSHVEAIVDAEPLLRHPLSIKNLVAVLAPDDANLAEQMSLIEVVPPPLRDATMNVNARRTVITARMQDIGLAKYTPVFDRVETKLRDVEAEFPGFRCAITGDPIVRNKQLWQIVTDMSISLGTACVVIFIVMTIAFRSLRLGLISIVPNMLPLAATAALLVLTGQTLTFTSVCAFTVCIGIAVDDTIHFFTRYHFCRAQGFSPSDAIRESFVTVGTALMTTTLVLVTGFATVLASPLPSHKIFAGMACCTIGTALVADLIFLPAMLSWFGGAGPERNRDDDHVKS